MYVYKFILPDLVKENILKYISGGGNKLLTTQHTTLVVHIKIKT